MENTWIYRGTEPIKIKKYLQRLGMGHRLFKEIKKGQGSFLVDHRPVRPTTKILPNQPLTIKVQPEPVDPQVVASTLPLQVVYDNANWLVINKPVGVSSIPGPSNQKTTILNRVKGYLKEKQSLDLRPHLITRLDRGTSGLLLVAKHHVASSMISQQVQQHQMLKEYLALVKGTIKNDHGMIERPIARRLGQARRVIAQDGQSAQTEYWVEKRNPMWTLVRVRLHTGRTHQIRVHFASIGHPLVGDSLYGGTMIGVDHQLLHAAKLSFNDPFTLRQLTFATPLPSEFQQFMTN